MGLVKGPLLPKQMPYLLTPPPSSVFFGPFFSFVGWVSLSKVLLYVITRVANLKAKQVRGCRMQDAGISFKYKNWVGVFNFVSLTN